MNFNLKGAHFQKIILAAAVVGAIVFVLTLYIGPELSNKAEAWPEEATAEYGRRLLRDTARYLGPDHSDPTMRFSGTQMACASCHLDIGTKPGTLSLLPAAPKYPRFSGRDGGMSDLRDRINGCMQRSMNGLPLPRDSIEIMAMERYILGLNEQYLAMGETRRTTDEQPAFVEPDRAASVNAGDQIYETRCQVCHGSNGLGLKATTNPADGYLFPPLWGDDSYNNGAGMNRVLTAARFIKARMPLGQADLTDEQAYDVSSYINSQPRPIKSALELDYPERANKPLDSPYPPYADNFPQQQHILGPFKPIREYYEQLNETR